MAQLEAEIAQRLQPYDQAVQPLQTIPGVQAVAAAMLVAEGGVDLRQFPSAKHLASWAVVCPGNQQSGGKRLSGRTRRGNAWLKAVLCEIAWANARSTTSSLGAQVRRLTRRRGVYRALIAVAHSLLLSSTTSSRPSAPTMSWGPSTSTTSNRRSSSVITCVGSNSSATPSPSLPLRFPNLCHPRGFSRDVGCQRRF